MKCIYTLNPRHSHIAKVQHDKSDVDISRSVVVIVEIDKMGRNKAQIELERESQQASNVLVLSFCMEVMKFISIKIQLIISVFFFQ